MKRSRMNSNAEFGLAVTVESVGYIRSILVALFPWSQRVENKKSVFNSTLLSKSIVSQIKHFHVTSNIA